MLHVGLINDSEWNLRMLFQKISLEIFFFIFMERRPTTWGCFSPWKSLAQFCFITKIRNLAGKFNFFIHLMRNQSIWHREDINYMQEIIPWSHMLSILLKAHKCWIFTVWILGISNHLNIVAIFFGLFSFLFSFCWNKTPSAFL